MARLNLGECCDGIAAEYEYSLTSPLAPGRIVGPVQPVGQVQPVESPTIPSQLMPAPTTMTMPGMVTTAQLTSERPQPDLTPRDLLRPLPTIVDNQPTSVAQCNSFSEWVDQNPFLAGGMLLALAWFTLGRKA